jgi:hypothetical protein
MKKRQSKESRATQSAARSTKARDSDDVRPDAWQRFERAVDIAVTTKPIHKPTKAKRLG